MDHPSCSHSPLRPVTLRGSPVTGSSGKSDQCRYSVHSQRIRCSCAVPVRTRLSDAIRLLQLSCKHLVIRKRMVILLAIVMNAVLTGGAAMHKVRHGMFRKNHNLPSPFQRCDAPNKEEAAVTVSGWCSHHRQRRSAQWALELRQVVGKTLCPFSVCEDFEENRRPQNIRKIVCLEAGCRCTEGGSYRCVQVVDEMDVLYLDEQEDSRANETWVSKKMKVAVGCVCSANVAQTGSTSYPNALDE